MNLALAIPFSMVMSFIGMVISSGFFEGWIIAWLTNLLIMIPIAYLCGLIFVPMSQHIMSKINWK
ncbi:MAG: DUF2798 domain-containing protein [Cytophagales bacterium]|nr:DUF2798 domain-containing protein [Cytophagales bacterium]